MRKKQRSGTLRTHARRTQKGLQYDIAISYASEDSRIVGTVVRRLKAEKGLKVFFSPDYKVDLWGKDEREFERIYGGGARVVVPFISKDYVRKEWPLREFRAAKRADKTRDYDSILPVRIDDSALTGLRRTVQYLSTQDHTATEIADGLIRRLRALSGSSAARVVTARRRDMARLAGATREALGIIVTSPLPADTHWLTELFPRIDWKRNSPFSAGSTSSKAQDGASKPRRQLSAPSCSAQMKRSGGVAGLRRSHRTLNTPTFRCS
ncbi:MAG TPA: toll/interleukin-1 receptor domain-containing protein [Thermoanaerobaculia bacterium]|jgi:hypothetical protein|nr:toll/interleukin-1 receptor domain-containing protein [Thermoanaerobaculia bacterium]